MNSGFNMKSGYLQSGPPVLAALTLAAISLALISIFVLLTLSSSSDTRKVDFRKPHPAEVQPSLGRPIPPMDVAAALKVSSAAIAAGKTIYQAQCSTCHGPDGLGNGQAGASLDPKPRNFAASEAWKNGFSIVTIFDTLSEGLASMPSFDFLAPEQRFSLAHYVQSLGAFDHGPEPEDAVQYLDSKYQLSRGGREPNRIPLSAALENALTEKIDAEIRMPSASDQSAAASLVRRMVKSPERVSAVLGQLSSKGEDMAYIKRIVESGAPANGFSPEVALLTDAEKAILFEYLSNNLSVSGGKQ